MMFWRPTKPSTRSALEHQPMRTWSCEMPGAGGGDREPALDWCCKVCWTKISTMSLWFILFEPVVICYTSCCFFVYLWRVSVHQILYWFRLPMVSLLAEVARSSRCCLEQNSTFVIVHFLTFLTLLWSFSWQIYCQSFSNGFPFIVKRSFNGFKSSQDRGRGSSRTRLCLVFLSCHFTVFFFFFQRFFSVPQVFVGSQSIRRTLWIGGSSHDHSRHRSLQKRCAVG